MSMSERQPHPRRRAGAYGIDAPYVPVIFGVGGLVLLGIAVLNAAQGINPWAIITCSLSGVWFLACAACYLHTTRVGKFAVWAEIIQGLQLRGAERVLDLGCGRGAVLLAIAQRLPHGQAIGIDLWTTTDQLRRIGMAAVTMRPLGWRFWYGGPWMAAQLVTGTKPP